MHPAKTQISLGICQWVAKDPSFLHANSEDSDKTGQMPRLILVFAGRTLTLLVLSCRGSSFMSATSINTLHTTYTYYTHYSHQKKLVFIVLFYILIQCTYIASAGSNGLSEMLSFWKKKIVTQHTMTVFQPALCVHVRTLACITWLKAKQSLRKYLGFSKNETQTTVVLHAY